MRGKKCKDLHILSTKAYRRSKGTTPLILDVGTEWRWVVNFTLRPFISGNKASPVSIEQETGWAPETVRAIYNRYRNFHPCWSLYVLQDTRHFVGGKPLKQRTMARSPWACTHSTLCTYTSAVSCSGYWFKNTNVPFYTSSSYNKILWRSLLLTHDVLFCYWMTNYV